jgi:hypothetical protein
MTKAVSKKVIRQEGIKLATEERTYVGEVELAESIQGTDGCQWKRKQEE